MFFYLLLPENTPRIWNRDMAGDMERGYGTGIWNRDMHAENKNARRRRAGYGVF